MTHAHPDDEGLLAYLEGEGSQPARRAIRLHLRACDACRARAREIRGMSRAVLSGVQGLDDPPASAYLPPTLAEVRRRRSATILSRPGMRWAAAIAALMTAGAVLASPLPRQVRGWFTDEPARVAVPGAPMVPDPREAPQPTTPEPQEFRFVPEPGEFRVTFASAAEGEIVLYPAEGRHVVFAVRTGDPAPHPVLLLPDGLHVSGGGGAAADYTLSVPPGVSRVRLRIGGLSETSIPFAQIAPGGLRIALRTGRPSADGDGR